MKEVSAEQIRELASEAQLFLLQDEFYSPIFLVLGGFSTFLLAWGLKKWTEFRVRRGSAEIDTRMFEALMLRFKTRTRISWVMIFFGGVWFLQIVAEKSGLVEWIAAR